MFLCKSLFGEIRKTDCCEASLFVSVSPKFLSFCIMLELYGHTFQAGVAFVLNFRYARNEGECVRFDDGSMQASYFNKSHPTMFFIHGYMGSGDDWYVNDLKNTLIDKVIE